VRGAGPRRAAKRRGGQRAHRRDDRVATVARSDASQLCMHESMRDDTETATSAGSSPPYRCSGSNGLCRISPKISGCKREVYNEVGSDAYAQSIGNTQASREAGSPHPAPALAIGQTVEPPPGYMKRTAAGSKMSGRPPSAGCTSATLDQENDEETGWCLKGCLPHQCGDQAARFLRAEAADEPPELPEPRCDWEDWAAKLDQRPAPSHSSTTSRVEETTAGEVFESHLNAWGSDHIFALNHPYLISQPSFGRHPYIQPLDLPDAASEGESKSKACPAVLSRGMCVCI